jgi:hypothetical protein
VPGRVSLTWATLATPQSWEPFGMSDVLTTLAVVAAVVSSSAIILSSEYVLLSGSGVDEGSCSSLAKLYIG